MKRLWNYVAIVCLAAAGVARAQNEAVGTLPDAPGEHSQTKISNSSPVPVTSADGQTGVDDSKSAVYRLGWMCGAGASHSSAGTLPMTGCGAGITLVPVPVYVEAGVMGPQANRSSVSGYVSADMSIALVRRSQRYIPMAMFGYSRLFETGHSLDYGLAIVMPRWGRQKNAGDSMRIEIRDYWTLANPAQHNVMLRLGRMAEETD